MDFKETEWLDQSVWKSFKALDEFYQIAFQKVSATKKIDFSELKLQEYLFTTSIYELF